MSHDVAVHLRRLSGLLMLGFALLALATFYWGFLRAAELAARPDNPRRIAFDRRIRRGALLDRGGQVLAATETVDGAPQRVYRLPSAAPVTGFQSWRYGAGGGVTTYGAGGAEAAYDAALRGDLGLSARAFLATKLLHRPQEGHDITLTLDAALQSSAAELLGDREGAAVVVDVRTGAVRALVSKPTFDSAALDRGDFDPDDPTRPMLNRATQGLYPPGSTWKTVTLAGALSDGIAHPADIYDDGDAVEHFDGYPVACNNNPAGVVSFDLAHAYAWSCNVTFARLGAEMGPERYRELAAAFGMGEAPPFALATAPGSLSVDDDITPPELAAAAFGQGELVVTPLHMALIAAAAAGDGRMPVPHLLQAVEGLDADALGEARGTWRRAMSESVAGQVREIMVTSVEDGWAASAVRGVDITAGGKTGTAQLADGLPHAWFIGFAPADEPRVAVAVLVVHGGDGGAVAAPIGGRILAQALALDADG